MDSSAGQSRYTAAIVGAAGLLWLLAVNLATSASESRVWLFGFETHIGCWFKTAFQAPCPLCGLTRSVILTLHGNLGDAFRLHIGGPLAILGLFVFCVLMIYSSLPNKYSEKVLGRRILIGTTGYFGIVTLVGLIYWIMRLSGYFPSLPELL